MNCAQNHILCTSQALKWDDRLADACGCEGIVLRDDESDGTAQAGAALVCK